MKGPELAERFFRECGLPMLEEKFPELLPYLAAGFTGSGSEHYGYDDEVSRDHDFEPGFCLFLPGEEVVSRRQAFLLERAYAGLPKEWNGLRRLTLSPVGGNRHGVFRTADFYENAVGSPDGTLDTDQWLHIPDYALAEAVNGKLFADNYGAVTRIRERLRAMPEDVKRKRIAGNLLLMAQGGQYNFTRCLRHGEPEAAQLACHEYVWAGMKILFLLRGRYMPFYKWSFRALREELGEAETAEDFSFLLRGDNREKAVQKAKAERIEKTAVYLVEQLKTGGMTDTDTSELETQAYTVNQRIQDEAIRNRHILTAV